MQGGERWIDQVSVDGYHHPTKTVFPFHGCQWHGCPHCFPDRYVTITISDKEKTVEEIFQATNKRTQKLRQFGYQVVEAWLCEVGKIVSKLPPKKRKSYPHAIFYDFETFGDKNRRKKPTAFLMIEDA